MRQFDALVTMNDAISPTWKALGFTWPSDLEPPKPGQFFTFRPSALAPGDSGLLRRPLAFAGFEKGRALALYQIKGRGTAALASLPSGSVVDLLGPLGSAFTPPDPDEAAILVGGGIGLGPILFLHHNLENTLGPDRTRLSLGFRGAAQIPNIPEAILARSLGLAQIATDDGSVGFHGRVASAIESLLSKKGNSRRRYYACGPSPMLAAIVKLAKAEESPTQVSVEQWMACGVGACHGCVVPSSSGGYLRACIDGPVFDAEALDWEALS